MQGGSRGQVACELDTIATNWVKAEVKIFFVKYKALSEARALTHFQYP